MADLLPPLSLKARQHASRALQQIFLNAAANSSTPPPHAHRLHPGMHTQDISKSCSSHDSEVVVDDMDQCRQSKQRPMPQNSSNSCGFQTSQLTIFYSGTVHVYDNVPANEAHALMLLAGSGGSSCFSAGRFTADYKSASPPNISATAAMRTGDESSTPVFSSPCPAGRSKLQFGTRSHTELPFARKASLTRFLEKRKDRSILSPVDNPGEKLEQTTRSNKRARPMPSFPSRPTTMHRMDGRV